MSWAYTLGVAGCHAAKQPDNGAQKDVCMVELQDLLDHWVRAFVFVQTHAMGKDNLDETKILSELRRHDEDIRTRWGKLFKDDNILTYSQVITSTKEVQAATNAWDTDYPLFL